MIKVIVTVIVLSGMYSMYGINWGIYQNAQNLAKEKRFDEAIALYEKAAAETNDEKDNAQYLQWAVNVAQSAKNPEKARELADKVKNAERRSMMQMRLMKPKEVINTFKDTDFLQWPEDIRAEPYRTRGRAYEQMKKYQEALADYRKALETPGGGVSVKGWTAHDAGMIYLIQMKDEAEAEKMFRQALTVSPAFYAWRSQSLIKLGELLVKQKRAEEAVKIYSEQNFPKDGSPIWIVAWARAYAQVLSAAGDNVKAMEQLEIALKSASGENQKKEIQKSIDALSDKLL